MMLTLLVSAIGRLPAILVGAVLLLVPGLSPGAQENQSQGQAPAGRKLTPADADAMFAAYNKAFYVKTGPGSGYFRAGTDQTNHTDFWKLSEEIEMVIDVYERSRNPAHSNQVVELLSGFNQFYGAGWTNNPYNDDVMWICIANLRAYQFTRNPVHRDNAKANFDVVFERAWDTNYFGGGMFWTVTNTTKNTCINSPAAVAACLLWKILDDPGYRAKANALIDWNKRVLSDGKGRIYDAIGTNGHINYVSLTYNQGTFIGACNYLGRTEDAAAVARFAMNEQGTEVDGFKILPDYSVRGDLAGFHGILLRWMAKYMRDQKLEGTYRPWLEANAAAAWKVRRADGLSWCRWREETPEAYRRGLPSWACSPSVVALQVIFP